MGIFLSGLDMVSGAADPIARCPVCRAKVVVRLENEVVIRNAILKVDPPTGQVKAKCARCKAWVQVPLRYVGVT
jgi:DNA-directed RNA polymerase subunit RPC12/RpoP